MCRLGSVRATLLPHGPKIFGGQEDKSAISLLTLVLVAAGAVNVFPVAARQRITTAH